MESDVKAKAREYLRVSYDRSGRERSNQEQESDNRRSWPGFAWGVPYSDAASASRYATKERDEWGVLLGDLKQDRFGAEVLVLWEASRGSRKVSEWCELLDLCEEQSVKIAITTHGRVYDPANPRDVRSLLDDANDSQYESGKISMRVTRAVRASAAEGRPLGRVPYGYRRIYDERTGQLDRQEPYEPEAVVVRELFERLLSGHTLRSIATDFGARGIKSPVAKEPFPPSHLGMMARNPLYIGKRVHMPGRRGKHTVARDMQQEGAIVTDAVWPPLVDEATFWGVQSILSAPERKKAKPGKGKHLVSMIALCDPCGGPVSARWPKHYDGIRTYSCRDKGCVRIVADELDAYAEAMMLAYLSRPDIYQARPDTDRATDDLQDAKAEVARIRAEYDDLMDRVGSGQLSAAFAARAEPQILERLAAAEQRERELATPSQLRGLIEPGDDVATRWKDMEMPAKRIVAKMLLAPDALGELRVKRSPIHGHRVPAKERVRWATTPDDADTGTSGEPAA